MEGTAGMATRASRKPSSAAVGSIAPMVVGTLNFCVATSFGAECGLTDLEAKLLIPSVQRSLERMPAGAASKAAVLIDPLVILTVLVMWGKRIANTKEQQAKEKYAIQPMEAARANGAAGTAYTVPTSYDGPKAATADIAAAAMDRSQQSEMPEATANGVPEEIRRSFSSDEF